MLADAMDASQEGNRELSSELEISVPGSIANLGPGFDTLAVAVQLYLRIRVRAAPGANELHFHFRGTKLDGENYIERAFRFLARQHGGSFPSLSIEVDSDIPARAGLGSSAAATVAGLRLYEAIAGRIPQQEFLNTACALERHPDNVAAAVLGGLTASCELPGASVVAVRLSWPESLGIIVLTPESPLSTSASRDALPATISRLDAVFNLQRLALLLQTFQSGELSFLREALQDRMHQPFRQNLVPGLEQALSLEHPDLLGVCLSGAGPSIVAFAEQNFEAVAELLRKSFQPLGLTFTIRKIGAHLQALDTVGAFAK